MRSYQFIIFGVLYCLLTFSCAKDKVPSESPEEPSIWSKISGTYKVYDTNWNYIHDMDISYKDGNQPNTDTLGFENFDNLFFYNNWQSPWGSMPLNYIEFGNFDTILDKNNNRWKIYQDVDPNFNILVNDTINIKFYKSNLLFYMEDLTPYYAGWVEQYAVRQ